jgi:hypothetical protein
MRWWLILVPIVALAAAAGVLFAVRGMTDVDCASFTDVRWEEMTRPGRCVRVEGMAHSVAALTSSDGAIVVPLFAPGDVAGREVRVFVRSTRAPSFVVDFEEMTVEGRALPGTLETVPPGSAEALAHHGYTLDDRVLVLEADRIDGGEGVWISDRTP